MSYYNNNRGNNSNNNNRINEQDVPKSKHTIFIRGLPGDLTTDEVKDYIEDRLSKITFDFVKLTADRSKLFVAVRFESRDEAREFMERYKDHDFMGYRCELTWFRDIRRFTAYQRMKEDRNSPPRRRQRSDSPPVSAAPPRRSRTRSRSTRRTSSSSSRESSRNSSRASSRRLSPVSSRSQSVGVASTVAAAPKDIPLPVAAVAVAVPERKKVEEVVAPIIQPKEIKINLKVEVPDTDTYPMNKFQPITAQKLEPELPKAAEPSPTKIPESFPTTSKYFGHLKEFQTNLLYTIKYQKKTDAEELKTLKLSAENELDEVDEEEKALLRELKLAKLNEEQVLRLTVRKKKFEEAYRSDCETYAIVTRALLSKDPSLEAGLKLAFLENIDELYQKMMDRVDDFINTL